MSVEQLTTQNGIERGSASKLMTIERTSYPTMREQFRKGLESMIEKSTGKIVVTSHKSPDPDALGSALGLREILKKKYPGKTIQVIISDKPVKAYEDFPGAKDIIWAAIEKKRESNGTERDGDVVDHLTKDDVLICVDQSTGDQFTSQQKQLEETPPCNTILLDHHRATPFPTNLSYIEPDAIATAELISNIYPSELDTLSPEAAALLWIGIWDDTNNLANIESSAKRAETEIIFRKLQQKSGKTVEQLEKLIKRSPQELHFKKLFESHRSSVINQAAGLPTVSYSYLTPSEKETATDPLALISDRLAGRRRFMAEESQKKAAEVYFTFIPIGTANAAGVTNTYSLMLRRRSGSTVDLSRFSGLYGGGGHMAAAAINKFDIPADKFKEVTAQKQQNPSINENELIARVIIDKINDFVRGQTQRSQPTTLAA